MRWNSSPWLRALLRPLLVCCDVLQSKGKLYRHSTSEYFSQMFGKRMKTDFYSDIYLLREIRPFLSHMAVHSIYYLCLFPSTCYSHVETLKWCVLIVFSAAVPYASLFWSHSRHQTLILLFIALFFLTLTLRVVLTTCMRTVSAAVDFMAILCPYLWVALRSILFVLLIRLEKWRGTSNEAQAWLYFCFPKTLHLVGLLYGNPLLPVLYLALPVPFLS